MRKLEKPTFEIENIISDCVESLTDEQKKNRILAAKDFICSNSKEYDELAKVNSLSKIVANELVNGNVTKDEMMDLYKTKFVEDKFVRSKYYDKLRLFINMCGNKIAEKAVKN